MKRLAILSGLIAAPLTAAAPPPLTNPSAALRTPDQILAAAAQGNWVAIAPSDLLVIDLAPDAGGKPRRVVIQLISPPFSQSWVSNIRKLAAARWYDGTAIVRVQDNYVVQWGDPDGEDPASARPLPSGLQPTSEEDYAADAAAAQDADLRAKIDALEQVAAMMEQVSTMTPVEVLRGRDPYALVTGFELGWPVASDGKALWPAHCYGSVGVGRDVSPDAGTGAELYAVIGHAPRQLDRNIAVVGRVIEGIEHLSSLPRGTGEIGFYEAAAERVPVVSVRMGSEVPGLPAYEYLSTGSASFAAYQDKRANRKDAFYIQPAGGVDVCNVQVPVRRAK